MITATAVLDRFLRDNTVGMSIPVVTITLADGTVLRWARYKDSDLSFGGTTWLAHGQMGRPLIQSYRWRTPLGLDETSTCEMALDCGETAVLGGVPFTSAAASGALREATFLLERLYLREPGTPVIGKLFRFYGAIVAAEADSQTVRLSVEGPAARLKAAMLPRTLITASCGNSFGDAACGIDLAAHRVTTTALAGCTQRVLNVSGTWADGFWDLGTVAIGSAPVIARRGIRASVNNAITLASPLTFTPAAGATITLTKGCDHSLGPKGCQRYANEARYRAEPFLPREAS